MRLLGPLSLVGRGEEEEEEMERVSSVERDRVQSTRPVSRMRIRVVLWGCSCGALACRSASSTTYKLASSGQPYSNGITRMNPHRPSSNLCAQFYCGAARVSPVASAGRDWWSSRHYLTTSIQLFMTNSVNAPSFSPVLSSRLDHAIWWACLA